MPVINFDPRTVAPDAGQPDALPNGWYVFIAKEMEVKPGDNGWSLSTMFEVVEPAQFKGRKAFHNFNMENTSEKAQNIGRAQLSALCYGVGHLDIVTDTALLYDRPFKGKVAFKPAEGQYQAKNEFKAFKPMSEDVVLGPSGGATPAKGAQAPTGPAGFPPPAQPVTPPPMQQQPQWQQPAQQPPMQQAPVQQAPVQQLMQQPVQQQQQPWNNGAQQPWQQPAAQAPMQQQAPVQQPPMQQPPMQQQAQPAWAAAPAYDPNVGAGAANSAAPAQQPTTAPSPEAQAAQSAPPPWARQG
jgi:hypothetical protein